MPDGLFPLDEPGAVFAMLFLLVLVGPLVAVRLRLPGLIGLVVGGMVVGPNVLGILARNTFIETLGYVGLLYLMFQGGLDLDLEGFRQRRRDSILFGVATLVLPIVLTVGVALMLDIGVIAAIIIGTAFASHTLLSFPAVARHDLGRNRAVTASLGATLMSTTAALLILAVAAAAANGEGGIGYWALFIGGLGAYVALTLIGVPRVTRWFFTGLGQDRQVRLTYLLSGMGLAAGVADLVGIEPIVGAFLIGLAFNPFVPRGTVISDRVRVLGETVFVPAFLISTGMLLNPVSMVADRRTLTLGAAFVVVAVGSKWVAAEVSGRILGVTRPERGLMFSLTVGQAAGALAAVIVAEELFLVGPTEVNAVVLVILVTALLAGLTGDRYAPQVESPDRSDAPLGTRVVVPVANPRTLTTLVRVSAQVAAPDAGAVVAVNVLPFEARPDQMKVHRELAAKAEEVALAAGSEVQTSVRIDSSTPGGVLHTVVEQNGTCVVVGWKGYANAREGLFGSVIDQIVAQSPVPVLVCRPGTDESTERIVVVITDEDLASGADVGARLSFEVGTRMARQAKVAMLVVSHLTADALRPHMERWEVEHDRVEVETVQGVVGHLNKVLKAGDVVITGMPPATSRLGRGARRLARAAGDRTIIVAVPH